MCGLERLLKLKAIIIQLSPDNKNDKCNGSALDLVDVSSQQNPKIKQTSIHAQVNGTVCFSLQQLSSMLAQTNA